MKYACALALLSCVAAPPGLLAQTPVSPPPPASIKVDFDQHVKPILAAKCFGCHGRVQQQSGLRLDLRQTALRGGDYGPVIVPGKSADSKLIARLIGSEAGVQMPPTGALEPEEIEVLRQWIDEGAEMPGRADETVKERPPTDPKVQHFLDAIHRQDIAAVRQALATDRSLAGSTDSMGSTPLMHAAYAGTTDIMNVLMDAGADVNAKNMRRSTALFWAVADPAKVRLLLVKGADVKAKALDGRTPLDLAVARPDGAQIVEMLLEAGSEVNTRTIVGTTALFTAAASSPEATRLLVKRGAEVNARSNTGGTPLMLAALMGQSATVALLLEHGADATLRTKRNETALAAAAGSGNIEAVKFLLDNGADVAVIDYRGYTPLMLAAYCDEATPELIRLLLARGADANMTKTTETALSLAAKRGENEVTRLLREAQTAGK